MVAIAQTSRPLGVARRPVAQPRWLPNQALAARRRSRRSAVRVVLAFALAFALIVLVVNAATYLGSVLRPEHGIDVTAGAVPAGTAPAAARADRSPSAFMYVVQPGDTLWSIAGAIAPDTDRRATVDRLAQRNGGASIEAGQRLVLE